MTKSLFLLRGASVDDNSAKGGRMRRRRRNAKVVVRMNEEKQKRNPFPLSNFGSGCASNNNENGEDDDEDDENDQQQQQQRRRETNPNRRTVFVVQRREIDRYGFEKTARFSTKYAGRRHGGRLVERNGDEAFDIGRVRRALRRV